MVDIFKALGDETRLRIVSLIMQGEVCVCEIEGVLELTQSNASRHLGVLKRADIIKSRKSAQWVFFSINKEFRDKNSLLFSYLVNNFRHNKVNIEDNNKCIILKEKSDCCRRV